MSIGRQRVSQSSAYNAGPSCKFERILNIAVAAKAYQTVGVIYKNIWAKAIVIVARNITHKTGRVSRHWRPPAGVAICLWIEQYLKLPD
jgi:hypothetical protein